MVDCTEILRLGLMSSPGSLAATWQTRLGPICGPESPRVTLMSFLRHTATIRFLEPLFAQVVHNLSLELTTMCLQDPCASVVQISETLEFCRFCSAQDNIQDVDRIVKMHIQNGGNMLAGKVVMGLATDSGQIRCHTLQNTLITLPNSMAVFACPQVSAGNLLWMES